MYDVTKNNYELVEEKHREKVKQWFNSVYVKGIPFMLVYDKNKPKHNLLVVIDNDKFNALPLNIFEILIKDANESELSSLDFKDLDTYSKYKDGLNFSGVFFPMKMYRNIRPFKKKENPNNKKNNKKKRTEK